MSSDKRKGKVQNAKAPSKQRTLLDSFVTRIPSKAVPLKSVEENMLPPATTDLQSSGRIGVSLEEEAHHMEALKRSPSPSPIPPHTPVPLGDSNDSPNLEDNGRRSPSIIIIGDTPEPPAVSLRTPLINSQEYHANASGKAKDLPIIIDLSLVKCHSSFNLEQDKKQIHSFFLPKSTRAVQASQMHYVLSAKKTVGTAIPPNPSLYYPRGMPQHVRGLQTTFACRNSPLLTGPRNIREQTTEKVANYDFLKSSATVEEPSPLSRRVQLLPMGDNDPANGIPEDIKASYPAVARLIDLKPLDKPTSNRPWADRWRPSCANEVLGNEQSAIYLRDWLRALELQLEETGAKIVPTDSVQDHRKVKVNGKTIMRGIKRPRVIRAVDRTRRKRSRLDSDEDEDNWIVYTDDDDDEEEVVQVNYDQLDEFGEIINDLPASSPSSSVHEPLTEKGDRSSYLGQLHNTILLTGPPGCGKTASVYACAEELGWDIFEVYPGIGRRNAANVDNLIGEVGKNHLVLQSRTSGDSLKSFLQSKAKRKSVDNNEEYTALSQISPRKKGTFGLSPEAPPDHKQSIKSVQQSLILLEEVDILFKEDTNFWTTVTKIIRECKRPVVCTCNDLSLVPVQDLPLQATLFYAPCPEGPAACYLQVLCAAEGYAVSWKDLLTLYSHPQRTLSAFNHTPDLRATINALQVISADAVEVRVDDGQQERGGITPSSLVPPRISVKGSDLLSFLDGSLDQNMASTHRVFAELGNHVPSDDDETGHIILFDRHAEDSASFEIYDRQSEILSAAAQLVNSVYGMEIRMGTSGKDGEKIRGGRKVAAREICRIAEDAVAVTLEYLPYVRQIVEAEDRQEEHEKRARVGRATRNSTRSQYVRMVELTDEGRAGVEMSGLKW